MSSSSLSGKGGGCGIHRGEMFAVFEKVKFFFIGILVSRTADSE